jgi:hypothetical protein
MLKMLLNMILLYRRFGRTGDTKHIVLVWLLLAALVQPSPAQSVTATTSYSIGGVDSVYAGSTASYTLSSAAADNWTVSCGSVSSQAPGMVTLNFAATTCTTVTLTALKGGKSLATKKIAIKPAAALAAVSIGGGSQNINYGQIPLLLNAPVASGGNCGGSYTYQWLSSPDNTNFTAIPGATAQNYQPGPLTTTSYFKRQTNCSGSLLCTSNSIAITVYAKTPAISLNPSSQAVNAGASPAALALGNASTTGGTFTYQWQQSANNSFSDATALAGANLSSYSPGVISTTTFYRLALIRNGDSLYSTPAVINVLPALSSGAISPTTQTITSGNIPALMVFAGSTGGDGNYTFQWYSSADGSNWTALDGVWSAGYNPSALEATTWYRVAVTSNGLSATSNSVVINVN